nr:ankyrin-1-like isoform X2 [Penaeus vannamei]
MGGVLNRAIAEGKVRAVELALSQGTPPDGDRSDKRKPIHLALDSGSLAIIELLCTKGADINVPDPTNEGRTPLHMAIRKNSPDIMKLLLAHQARPNVRDSAGETPLHIAIHMNAITSVDLLLKYKANVHLKDASHNFPLHTAVRKNNYNIIRMLLNAGASVHIVDASGDWLLHVAARIASTRILQVLKEKGCDVNKRNADGSSPLHLAAESGNLEAVRWFTHNGAKLDGLEARKKSPDGRAVGAKQKHVVPEGDGRRPVWLVHRPRRTEGREQDKEPAKEVDARTLIKEALASGDFKNLIKLIEKGTDVDTLIHESNDQGMRAVHYAAQSGNMEMLRALKQRKVDLKSLTSKGFTALHYAVLNGHLDAVRWLVAEAGLDAASRSKGGETALDLAKTLKKADISNYLQEIAQRAERQFLTPRRWRIQEAATAVEAAKATKPQPAQGAAGLHLVFGRPSPPAGTREGDQGKDDAKGVDAQACVKEALASGDFKNLIKLIEKGTDVDTLIHESNDQGMRAVHYAAQSGNMEMLRALKQRKVDLKSLTSKDFTALHYAVLNGHLDAVRWLVAEAGLDAASAAKGGKTALDLAKTLKKTEIVIYLNEVTQGLRGAEGTTARLLIQATRVREGEATRDLNLVKQAREAARAGDVRRVREVLRRGFGIETEFQEAANRGWRLLHFAADRGHSALVALLMQENAHVNASTKDGMTPLHLASWGGHAEVIGVLLAKRADGNAKTTEGMTAIHLAGMGGHVSSMEALTPACDILSVTREGKSALHLAAEYGNLGAVQWLLLQGLDASIRDKKGWTPRQYAKDEGHRKVVEVLEKLEKQRLPQGFAQQQKIVKDLQEKLQARETEINRLNRQQAMKDRIQERAQAQIKNELQEMRETLRAQSEMIVRLQSTMLTKAEPGKETQN